MQPILDELLQLGVNESLGLTEARGGQLVIDLVKILVLKVVKQRICTYDVLCKTLIERIFLHQKLRWVLI